MGKGRIRIHHELSLHTVGKVDDSVLDLVSAVLHLVQVSLLGISFQLETLLQRKVLIKLINAVLDSIKIIIKVLRFVSVQ